VTLDQIKEYVPSDVGVGLVATSNGIYVMLSYHGHSTYILQTKITPALISEALEKFVALARGSVEHDKIKTELPKGTAKPPGLLG
jgi:hypothetical protein